MKILRGVVAFAVWAVVCPAFAGNVKVSMASLNGSRRIIQQIPDKVKRDEVAKAISPTLSPSEMAEFVELMTAFAMVEQFHYHAISSTQEFKARYDHAVRGILAQFSAIKDPVLLQPVKLFLQFSEFSSINEQGGVSINPLLARAISVQLKGKVSTDDVWNALINQFLSELDPHSKLYLGVDAQRMNLFDTNFTGIGIEFDEDKDGEVVVVDVNDFAPAAAAGIQVGDHLLSVRNEQGESVELKGMATDSIVKLIVGPEGTTVDLDVRRETGKVELIHVVRAKFPVQVVKAKMLPNGMLWVRLKRFQDGAAGQLKAAIEKYPQAKGIIFDLRGNPGGLLSEAVKVDDLFVDRGLVVGEVTRNGIDPESLLYATEAGEISLPMVVMIDGGSASASEIVAQSLSPDDFGRAPIVGTSSFGKGSVQITTMNPSKSKLLAITRGLYFTRSGTSPQRAGVTPNYFVADPNMREVRAARDKTYRETGRLYPLREEEEPYVLPVLEPLDKDVMAKLDLAQGPVNRISAVLSGVTSRLVEPAHLSVLKDPTLETSTNVLGELIKRCVTYRVQGCHAVTPNLAKR